MPVARVAKRVHLVEINAGATVDAKVEEYAARQDVVYAEPNYIASISLDNPNDPNYGSQWGLTKIDAPAAWSTYPGRTAAAGR